MKKILAVFACFVSFEMQAIQYEQQFENDEICVAKVGISPGEEIPLHRDEYPQVVIALQGGTITRLEADGKEVDIEFPTGQAVLREADPEYRLHRSVNRSSEPVELVIIQLKSGALAQKERRQFA